MTEVFIFSFNAVMPILLLTFTGFIVNRLHFADDAFYKKLNSLVFKLFLPVMLFLNVYEIDSLGVINWRTVIYCVFAILVICFIGFIVAKTFFNTRERLPVVTQCAFRSNYAIIGIPLAQIIGGEKAVAFACVLSAFSIPVFNTLATVLLSHYSNKKQKGEWKSTVIKTLKNPLIIGVFFGLVVLFIRSFMPVDQQGNLVFSIERDLPFVYQTLSFISKATTPVALIVLGARFDFKAVKGLKKELCAGVLMRLVAAPVIGIGAAYLLSANTKLLTVTAVEYPALIALFATPVAVSSAVMVSEIGGDEQLANQYVVWTSLFSMFTMFVVIFILKSINLI